MKSWYSLVPKFGYTRKIRMQPSKPRFIMNLWFTLIFCGCVKKEIPRVEDESVKAPVLVESEMMVKVQECRVCHGTQEAQRGPILDGMEYWYLSEQLQKFHAGIRGQNPENRSEYLMGVGARKINNQVEIAYLADWFAKQEPKPAIRTIQGDKVLGKNCMNNDVSSVMENGRRETIN